VNRQLEAVRSAIGFLTPLGGATAPSAASLDAFPLVGAGIGASVGLVWVTSRRVLGPLAGAAVTVAADALLTGALHLDGVADAADGLLAHLPRERRLEVMAEPAVGAFGQVGLSGLLMLRVGALADGVPSVWLPAALWSASRALMAIGAARMPYARPRGLATAFRRPEGRGGGGWAPLVAFPLVMLAADRGVSGRGTGHASRGRAGWASCAHAGLRGAAVVAPALAAGAGVLALGRRQLGGFTGDVLGAAGVVTETVGLLVAVALAGPDAPRRDRRASRTRPGRSGASGGREGRAARVGSPG
jgi:adenosylcobinamide-GDP ribazoletransferase